MCVNRKKIMHGLKAVLVLAALSTAGIATADPIIQPAHGTERMCAHGIQMNPVVTAKGHIAYRNWTIDGFHGAGLREGFFGPELDLYASGPGTPGTRCSNLAASNDSFACTLHEVDDGRYWSKSVRRISGSVMNEFTTWGRSSFVSIWDEGFLGGENRAAASRFEGGRWHIHLAGNLSPGSGTHFRHDFHRDGDLDEPAVSRRVIAWVERQRWEPEHRQWSVWYAHEADGYSTVHFLGYGRHPSVTSDGRGGDYVAFEEIQARSTNVVAYAIAGPGAAKRIGWRPHCKTARRPVLSGIQILYTCWEPEVEEWALYLSSLDVSSDFCTILMDYLRHFPDEDEASQYHMTETHIVYSKLDNPASMRFGVWYNGGLAVEHLARCRGGVGCIEEGSCKPGSLTDP